MDGGPRGELEFESFSADAITITFRGFNTHPGLREGPHGERDQAGRALHRAAARRPVSPETTERREGFVHPYVVDAAVDQTR